MAVNKVVLGEDTLIDLTGDTVSADKLAKGTTAHNMAGESIIGTMEAGGGKEYTFTDGLTETDGTVSLDLFSKGLKPYNNSVGIGSFKQANNPTFKNTGYNNLVVGGSEGNYSTYPMF